MKHFFRLFGILLMLFSGAGLRAQIVHFEHGSEVFPENIKSFTTPESTDPGVINNQYVRYVQFGAILTTDQQKDLENQGVVFMGYVNFGAYLLSIPIGFDVNTLAGMGAKSLVNAEPEWKMHHNLKERPFGLWALHGQQIDISLKLYPFISIKDGAALARKNGLTVLETGTQNGYLLVRADQNKLTQVAALPFVEWIEQMAEPSQKEDINGRSLHRANLLDSDHPLGKKYNGAGVNILVRDDGAVGPHIDFQGRLYNQDGVSAPDAGTHGDGVAGVIGAAGNLDPTKKGMAAGADIYVINYTSEFQDGTLPLFLDNNVTITNTSYSNGCNDGYTVASQTVDQQIYDHPTLMHVFSAGNSNGSDCDYGAGAQWGNITGGHKMAKNAIATANLRVDGVLETSSSRGPAHDGRMKPDISAHGTDQNSTSTDNTYQVFGGTSAASPGIAGCLGQLTQAYRTINQTADAPSALLKLTILTTANEMGNIGPDYKFGWGHVNNYRALKLLEEHRHTSGTIAQGNQNTHSVTIPAGVKQAKLMIYWVDPPANVAAARALLNDLDIKVTGPNGTTYLPWKLNPTPDPVILDTPAGVGRDSLNNMEQVSIIDPVAGTYNIVVKGYEVPFGPQSYYLAWDFLDDKVKLTYPSGGEALVPGTKEWIRWDAYGNTGAFTLKYTTNGTTYTTISSPANNVRMLEWTVPTATSGKVKMVITRGTSSDTTQFPLTIAPQPTALTVQKVCPDSVTLKWTAVGDNSLQYDVFQLGQKYMEIKGTAPAAATQLTIPISDAVVPSWFSVRTSKTDGLAGRRLNAVNWPGGLLNCPQDKDLTITGLLSPLEPTVISCSPVTKQVKATVKNAGGLAATGGTIAYQVNSGTPVVESLPVLQPGQSIDYTFNTPLVIDQNGNYQLTVTTNLAGEVFVANNNAVTNYKATVTASGASFVQDFEGAAALPDKWSVVNPDNGISWQKASAVGADGNTGKCMFVDHYDYSNRQQPDYLYLPPLDFSNDSKPYLTFNYSHAQYNSSYAEKLSVELFPNCDLTATPIVLWQKTDPDLSFTTLTSYFIPDAPEDWRSVELSLEQYVGQSMLIRFNALNDYGNNTYLDNVVIQNRALPVAGFNGINNACTGVQQVYTANPGPGENNQFSWNFGATAIPPTATGAGPHQVVFTQPGNQTVQLTVSNDFGTSSASQIIQVGTAPTSAFTSGVNGDIAQFTNQSQGASSYFWQFGDGQTSTLENPQHTYAADGNYTVRLTVSNSCGMAMTTSEIQVITDLSASFTANITGECAPVNVSFGNTSTPNAISFLWDFPGGTPSTSTEENPNVVYNTPGDYPVSLTISNGFGNSTFTQQGLVHVKALPTSVFVAPINTKYLTIPFDNQSISANTSSWDFGDGEVSTAEYPIHTFPGDGVYTVSLTVSNDCGVSTSTQTISILTPPTAGFYIAPTTGCAPFTASFTNQSSANSASFQWQFPGGSPATSTDANPTVTYLAPGTYSVTLTAFNASGTSELTQDQLIIVKDKPVAEFGIFSNDYTVSFTNLSSNATNYHWDFGDGNESTAANPQHQYSATGHYTALLTATNGCGTDTYPVDFNIGSFPGASFTSEGATVGCAPLSVQFHDTSLGLPDSLSWHFTGGTPSTSSNPDPQVAFAAPGVYNVSLEVFNFFGGDVKTANSYITVLPEPLAQFTTSAATGTVTFTNTSLFGTTWLWDLGDGFTTSETSPVHTYSASGTYTVTLTVTNACGISTATQTVTVTVVSTDELPSWMNHAQVYPNPNTGSFVLDLKGKAQPMLVMEMRNSIGQVVYNKTCDFSTGRLMQPIEAGALPSGSYFLRVRSGESSFVVPVFVTR